MDGDGCRDAGMQGCRQVISTFVRVSRLLLTNLSPSLAIEVCVDFVSKQLKKNYSFGLSFIHTIFHFNAFLFGVAFENKYLERSVVLESLFC